ncbi:DUF2911 domain-containing protein [Mucilaginibacter sp. KACC 22063]|uniref:DUF2911 domain-containing protein n=1 Tax=Mucilaginibacter sp. KACC 22063 TaxID=3025666 RepID=UPI0023650776|nr:DUF2911 domain-containing protein [Mucilaginibacter sp. KACC 22063]WDF55301.1 DUF2911 domain-containing protein [Mucilaginibacter sp. KACC 22063]
MKRILMQLALLATLCFSADTFAQLKMPNASSSQTITQEFGLGTITLTYSRPNVKGRKIFGEGTLQPYGEVWRTGANQATVIKFSDDVTIEGNKIPAGEYGLFSIPGKNEWTIIINKTAKQWGAYEYKQADDVVRFKVKSSTIKPLVETFTMQFANVKPTSCDLQLMWEHTALTVHLTTEVDSRIMANIDEAMKGEKKPYFAAAVYYYENGKDLNKALEWMNILEKQSPTLYYYKLWKARILLKMGDKADAIATAKEGVALAKADKSDEYVRLNEAVISQAK